MGSILKQNVVTVEAKRSPTTGHDLEIRKDTNGEITIADSSKAAPDNMIEVHASDERVLRKYGMVV